MIHDLIKDRQFQELEKEYKFLSRARGESLDSLDYIVLDIETTGLEPTQHELTEIGALKIKGKELQNIFSSLILPQNPIPPEITRLTGIDNDMVKDSPSARQILPSFLEFIDSSILVAHNADFDVPFLKHHLKQLTDQELTNESICTVKIARFLLPELESYKLHNVASCFGIQAENRHRAVGDAELTFQIWIKFIDLLKEKGIANKRDLDSLISRL